MQRKTTIFDYQSPLGIIKIIADESYLLSISFGEKGTIQNKEKNRIIMDTTRQLDEYFRGKRRKFNLPLKLDNYTPFQRKVWQALSQIPFAHTMNYSDLATIINRPGAFRALGNACGKNPYPIIIPCHRVIKKDGSLGGFSAGIGIKLKLLEFEQRVTKRKKIHE